jgi:outer membrane protease
MKHALSVVIAALAILRAPNVSAQVSLEVSTSAGVMLGTSREIVLDGSYVLSQLDWAMQPLFFTGSELRASTPEGMRASLEVRSGVPGRTGRITDKDWANYDGVLTHYSEHDCFTEGALLADARVGWEFTRGEKFSIEPFAGFSLMRFKWTARDGFLRYDPAVGFPYPAYDPVTSPKFLVFGTGIVYQQTWYIPVAGVRGTLRFSDTMDARFQLGFSPFMWMNDLDNHELRLLDFWGYMSGGVLLDPSVAVSWRVSPRARLGLDLSYRVIWGLVGDVVTVVAGVAEVPPPVPAPGTKYFDSGMAGAAYDAFSLSLSLDVSL